MENRRRARTLGGRELSLDEARAVRMVLSKTGRVTDEQLEAMDADIERMESVRLLEDLEYLHERNFTTLVKLEQRPNSRLSHDDEVHLLAWLRRVEELQRNHCHHLHVGHLLTAGGGDDAVLWDLNVGYQHLGVLSKAEDYRSRGLIDPVTDRPTAWLRQLLTAMTSKAPLLDHLDDEGECAAFRQLWSQPDDPIQRARLLHIYSDYIEFALIENAYAEPGSLRLPSLGRGRTLPGHHGLQEEADPDSWMRGTLEELGVRLQLRLQGAKS